MSSFQVNAAWVRIADAMGVPVIEVKKKKETLLASFRLNHKKVLASHKTGAGENEIFKPAWIYYDTLAAFMSDVVFENQVRQIYLKLKHFIITVKLKHVANDLFKSFFFIMDCTIRH